MKNKEDEFNKEDVAKMKSIIMKILTTDFGNDTVTDMKNKENDFKEEDVVKMKSIVETILYTDTSVTLPGICTHYSIERLAQNNVDDLADTLGSLSLGNGNQIPGDVADLLGDNNSINNDDLYAD